MRNITVSISEKQMAALGLNSTGKWSLRTWSAGMLAPLGCFFGWVLIPGGLRTIKKITEVGNSELGWGWVTCHSKGPKDTVLETCIASCMATKIWWKLGCGLQTSLPKLWKQWMFIVCILLVDFFQASTKYQWIGFWQNWKLNRLLLPLYLYLSIHVYYIYIYTGIHVYSFI